MNSIRIRTFVYTLAISCLLLTCIANADTFGVGTNQFDIDFVSISGATNPDIAYGNVPYDYRIGVYEITNDQWDKFAASYGTVAGSPTWSYDTDSRFQGANIPVNCVSWYEAAQFANWLNISSGYQPAYRFTGTQGTDDYTFDLWSESEAAGGTNLYRHKDAKYFLPSEAEWVKAAFWNGSELQRWSTQTGEAIFQGDGESGTGWNVEDGLSPWEVGTGSQELNGTYDMLGNLWEHMETPYDGNYTLDAQRIHTGGAYFWPIHVCARGNRYATYPDNDIFSNGFRVASVIPEPAALSLLLMGSITALIRKR